MARESPSSAIMALCENSDEAMALMRSTVNDRSRTAITVDGEI